MITYGKGNTARQRGQKGGHLLSKGLDARGDITNEELHKMRFVGKMGNRSKDCTKWKEKTAAEGKKGETGPEKRDEMACRTVRAHRE